MMIDGIRVSFLKDGTPRITAKTLAGAPPAEILAIVEDMGRELATVYQNLGATQARCTTLLDEVRAQRRAMTLFGEDDALRDAIATLVERVRVGREKYPRGASPLSLFDEVGEYAHAVNKREGAERERAELFDVLVVALRLAIGESEDATSEAEWRASEKSSAEERAHTEEASRA